MRYAYVSFVSLVLHDVHGNTPIFPFNPSTGKVGNVGYHYHPTVSVKEMPEGLGYVISHYQDKDSRRICCLEAADDAPENILIDAAEQGFAAWGGRVLSEEDALALANHLSPERTETWQDFDPENPGEMIEKSRTYGPITLDEEGVMTREITEA